MSWFLIYCNNLTVLKQPQWNLADRDTHVCPWICIGPFESEFISKTGTPADQVQEPRFICQRSSSNADSSWLCHECTHRSVSVCARLCVRHRASAVCVAAPKLCKTADWNECLSSKPCGSKLIPLSDVNLRIELLWGVQAHADTWWHLGQSVRTCPGACAFEWCCTCPF